MEISKAVELLDAVTKNVSGTREDHKLISEAIQSVVVVVQEYFKQKEEIVELCKTNETLKNITKEEIQKVINETEQELTPVEKKENKSK